MQWSNLQWRLHLQCCHTMVQMPSEHSALLRNGFSQSLPTHNNSSRFASKYSCNWSSSPSQKSVHSLFVGVRIHRFESRYELFLLIDRKQIHIQRNIRDIGQQPCTIAHNHRVFISLQYITNRVSVFRNKNGSVFYLN